MNYILRKYSHFPKSLTRKIKYDRHGKINVKQQLGFLQNCKRTQHRREEVNKKYVDFLWQRQNMSIAPLFVTTQNTTEPSYAQSQDVESQNRRKIFHTNQSGNQLLHKKSCHPRKKQCNKLQR